MKNLSSRHRWAAISRDLVNNPFALAMIVGADRVMPMKILSRAAD
jgi:hypothetical protein